MTAESYHDLKLVAIREHWEQAKNAEGEAWSLAALRIVGDLHES